MPSSADHSPVAPPGAGDSAPTGSPLARFRRFHFRKQVAAVLGLARGAVWRLRGWAVGWPVVHPTVHVENFGGRLRIGHLVKLSRRVFLIVGGGDQAAPARLQIGRGTRIWDGTRIVARTSVTIGERCAISWNCAILDGDLHRLSFDGENWEPHAAPVVIGDDVWIGCGVTVLKGVTIGAGSVIAAGAVVSRDIPPRTLAAGVPAKPVREVAAWR